MSILNNEVQYIRAEDLVLNKCYLNTDKGVGIYIGCKLREGIMKYTFKYDGNKHVVLTEDELIYVRDYVNYTGKEVKLHSVEKKEFAKQKAKTLEKINSDADSLLEVYAKRLDVKGFKFEEDGAEQEEFENGFEFELTPSQKQTLVEIKSDMISDKVTDRLIYGDVGSGKTAIAMTSIFRCAINHYQSILLVPSTILAQQHYNKFIEQFAKYPDIKICLLTSGLKKSEKVQMIEDIKNGDIDIIIGTQSILSGVEFHNLKLLVTDEQHRFGVKDRDKLKVLKGNLEVLEMTATPIPRSLLMTQIGLRDMSVLESIKIRKPIESDVLKDWDEDVIKSYIDRELARDGQVFFIYNNIEALKYMKAKLLLIDSGLKIGIVHGKMKKDEIKSTMNDFINKKFDVLLASTVIEVGVDIPNANTIIIYGAERLGLAQAHQLKGRCGRSNKQAYCLFISTANKQLTNIAKKRLKALKETNNLGGGIKLASIDLQLRGGGSILSTWQNGKMGNDKLPMDYYIELLRNVVIEKKVQI